MNWASDYTPEKFFDAIKKEKLNVQVQIETHGDVTLEIPYEQLNECVEVLRAKYCFNKMIEMTVIPLKEDKKAGWWLSLLIERMDDAHILYLFTKLENELSSDQKFYDNNWSFLQWKLREINDLYGVKIDKAKTQPLFTIQGKDQFFRNFKIANGEVPSMDSPHQWFNYGPYHPMTNYEFRLLTELIEDEITKSEIEVGYNHVGIEKYLEKNDVLTSLSFLETYKTISSYGLPILWCKTIEELYGIEISDRVMSIRMLGLELERIKEHLCTLYKLLISTHNHFGANELKKLYGFFCQISSFFLKRGLNQIGGLSQDVERQIFLDLFEQMNRFEEMVNFIQDFLTSSRQWIELLQTKKLTAAFAMMKDLEGPNLRACGIKYDLRKNNPYYLYREVDFEIPLGTEGTSYDRYLVRMKEIIESNKIILQILENIPNGDIQSRDINKLKNLNTRGDASSKHFHLSRIEGPRGAMGIFAKPSHKGTFDRVKIIGPSYKTLSALNEILVGEKIENAHTLINSLDINIFEVDR